MDNGKGQTPQNHVVFGTIILYNICNVPAIVKVVARCFLHMSLIYLSCLNNDLFGSVQHQKELHSMVSTWEARVSINTKQFPLSSRTHVDLADQEDAVCEEVYSSGLAKNRTALLQIYFLPTLTCTSGCACRSSGHLALPCFSFCISAVQSKQGFVVFFFMKNSKAETAIFHMWVHLWK